MGGSVYQNLRPLDLLTPAALRMPRVSTVSGSRVTAWEYLASGATAVPNAVAVRDAAGNASTSRFPIGTTRQEIQDLLDAYPKGQGFVPGDGTEVGGTIYMAEKTIDLGTTPLYVASGQALRGFGIGKTILKYTGTGAAIRLKAWGSFGFHTNSSFSDFELDSEGDGFGVDDIGGLATVFEQISVQFEHVDLNCVGSPWAMGGSSIKYHMEIHHCNVAGFGNTVLDVNVSMLGVYGLTVVNNRRSNDPITAPIFRINMNGGSATFINSWLEQEFDTAPLIEAWNGILVWMAGHIEPHGQDNNPHIAIDLHDGYFTFDQTWFVQVGSQMRIRNGVLNILTYLDATEPAPSGAPLPSTDWHTVYDYDNTGTVLFRCVDLRAYTVSATQINLSVSGYIRTIASTDSYSQFQHFNAAGLSAFPRGIFRVFGAGETNVGTYFVPGHATGSTQTPAFLAVSTNESPTQASSAQAFMYIGPTEVVIGTWAHEDTNTKSRPVYLGGSKLDGSNSPLKLGTDGSIVVQPGVGTFGTGNINAGLLGDQYLLVSVSDDTLGLLAPVPNAVLVCAGDSVVGWSVGALPVSFGGTGNAVYVAGDLIYASGTTTLARLAKATNGQVLASGSSPFWTGSPSFNGSPTVSGGLSIGYQSSPDSYAIIAGSDGSWNSRVYTGGVFAGRIKTDATGLAFFGVSTAARQTGGAATAGGTYTAAEQAMIQKSYDALRTYGLLT